MACYGSALCVALFLLWQFGQRRWYWHAVSVALALAIAFYPGNEFLGRQDVTLATGWMFTFLFIWGIAAPAFPVRAHGFWHFHLPHGRH
jgi:hypothetical protein